MNSQNENAQKERFMVTVDEVPFYRTKGDVSIYSSNPKEVAVVSAKTGLTDLLQRKKG